MLSDLLIPAAFAAEETAAASSSLIDLLGQGLLGLVVFALGLVLAMAARSRVKAFVEARAGEQHRTLVLLYSRITFIGIALTGALVGLMTAGVPLQLFAGGLGLGVGLAIRDPLENFIASMMLLVQDKFGVGDRVQIGEERGTITDIGIRTTTLRGFDGVQITIPNIDIISSRVTCLTRNPLRRISIEMWAGYDEDIDRCKEIILATLKKDPRVEVEPTPTVRMIGFGDANITFEARAWVTTETWLDAKSDLMRDIWNALAEANINISYTVQTLRIDKENSGILADQNPETPRHPLLQRLAREQPVLAPEPELLKNLEAIEQAKSEPAFAELPAEPATIPTEPITIQSAPEMPVATNPEPVKIAAGPAA